MADSITRIATVAGLDIGGILGGGLVGAGLALAYPHGVGSMILTLGLVVFCGRLIAVLDHRSQ